MDSKNKKKAKLSVSNNTASVIAIIVVGVFVLCVIFLLARGLFTSNSKNVPAGIDTATINTDTNTKKMDNSAVQADNSIADSSTDSSESSSESESSSLSDSSQIEEHEKMYVTEYAYLHTAPANDAENIVCMSPGVEVTVLNYEDNGYVKITFQNIDGPLTGYIYKDYLASYSQTTTASSDDAEYQSETSADNNYYNDQNDQNYNYDNGYDNTQDYNQYDQNQQYDQYANNGY